jgi:hypothetical protein
VFADMFFARSHIDLHNIRQSVERIGNISDNVIHFGPIKLGLEAVLEFVPFLGEIYSLLAGALLLIEAARARAPGTVLMSVAFLVGARTLIGSSNLVPGIGVVGEVAAAAFRAHKMSADMIAKAMDETLYVEGHKGDSEYEDLLARVRAGQEKRRIVYLQ